MENVLQNPGKLSAEYHRFLPAGCIMCGGAVNRQPGYRARNLQRWNKEQTIWREQRKTRRKRRQAKDNQMERKRTKEGWQKNIGTEMKNPYDASKTEKQSKTRHSPKKTAEPKAAL